MELFGQGTPSNRNSSSFTTFTKESGKPVRRQKPSSRVCKFDRLPEGKNIYHAIALIHLLSINLTDFFRKFSKSDAVRSESAEAAQTIDNFRQVSEGTETDVERDDRVCTRLQLQRK